MTGLELWGGLECSVTRVRDDYRDQLRETGHHDREGDLARIGGLGIRTLRTTCAWERVAPDREEDCDWSWHDRRLAEMRALGMEPVLGLVHHGSGPRRTSLLDPGFPDALARYAAQVARRYPWVTRWTPVNEPLTTARFSGLYGWWFPHRSSEADCLLMLHHECRGVLLSMEAIRREVPGATLVQTDDLGRHFATPPMQPMADEANERRWLGWDLLLGRVDPHHPWHARLLRAGVAERELEAYREADIRPMIVGLNHYVTSDRFYDDRRHIYPAGFYDPDGPDRHVDCDAVRAGLPDGSCGWLARLREAHARYGDVPLAVTECHLGAEPEAQAAWLAECWEAAQTARSEGADVRAVTVWSLLGAVDWNSVLTERRGFYEAGAFDVRGGTPVLTPLGEAVRTLARDGRLPPGRGWWQEASCRFEWLRQAGEAMRV